MTSPIAAGLATWTRRAQAAAGSGDADYADQLLAAADRAEHEARLARQAANRHASYERTRPARYAAAAYGTLHPHQDPGGLISAWWTRGPRTLVIAGVPRVGKTTAAYAIANHAHTDRAWVYATGAAALSAALKPDGDHSAHGRAVGADLLVIDDLGRERATEWWLEQLQLIVEERCAHVRRLVVTTNADPRPQAVYDTLADRYGEPIAERLIDGGGIVGIDGPAVRELVTSW